MLNAPLAPTWAYTMLMHSRLADCSMCRQRNKPTTLQLFEPRGKTVARPCVPPPPLGPPRP